jgi:DNA oxidative demethylase
MDRSLHDSGRHDEGSRGKRFRTFEISRLPKTALRDAKEATRPNQDRWIRVLLDNLRPNYGQMKPGSLEVVVHGALVLRAFAKDSRGGLFGELLQVLAKAPLRFLTAPNGCLLPIASTVCGKYGGLRESSEYRYAVQGSPERATQPLPSAFVQLARRAAAEAGYRSCSPNVCLIRSYAPGTRQPLRRDDIHNDPNEPVVCLSLGLPTTLLFGIGPYDVVPRITRFEDGDVAVWGGPARHAFYGFGPSADGNHLVTGSQRFSLTFCKASTAWPAGYLTSS